MKSKKETIASSSSDELEKKLAGITLELERKNRYLEIEASLDRVRAVAMGMRKPDDLQGICEILFIELEKLDFNEIRNSQIFIYNDQKGSFMNYGFSEYEGAAIAEIFYNSHPKVNAFVTAVRKTNDAFAELSISGDELKTWRDYRIENGEPDDPRLANINTLYYYFYSIGVGAIGISNFESISAGQLEILKRFRNVFDFAYRRYADVAQAETQAREAQIELGLERVRARTMAMQHSNELAETAYILFQQFRELGENPDQATIGIINEAEGVIEYWVTIHGSQTNRMFKFPIDEANVTNKIYKAWKKHHKSLVIDLSGKALHDFSMFRESMGRAEYNPEEKRRIINVAFFSKGLINVQSTVERSVESLRLLERFAKVFDGTYTRFLDLKKAEAQAREAQIEAALEKVRSRSLAMHKSDELQEVVTVVFEKLDELKFDLEGGSATIAIPVEGTKSVIFWVCNAERTYSTLMHVPYFDSAVSSDFWNARENGTDLFNKYYSIEQKNIFWKWAFEHSDFKFIPETRKKFVLEANSYILTYAFGKHSAICITNLLGRLLSASEFDIVKRFAKVFEQAYVRFLDLQKAEAQAREAQIEAALEKVRSRSLAMHQTDELREVVTVVFDKLHDLGIVMEEEAASIVIFTEGTKDLILWNAIPDQLYSKSFHIPYYDTAVIKSLLDAKGAGADFFKRNYTPEEKDHFWKWAVEYSDYKNIPDNRKKHILERKYFACSVAYAKNSAILISSYAGKLLSEKESEILKRFARVFEQAYVRFLDLHKAEVQAHEAEIELGLERVRARSMAMQKSDELKEIIKVVYEQLVHLNIPVEHAGFIIDYNINDDMHIWLADKHYTPSQVTIPYFDSPHWNSFNEAKQKGLNFFANYHNFEEKNKFYQGLFKLIPGVTEETKEYYFSCPGLAISTVLLENVGLYIENFSGIPYTDDENATLMRFGKVFQQTYTRFLDLKQVEEQAREAQIQLALERVRARTMAMQKSGELAETVSLLFKQLLGLGIRSEQIRTCGIVTFEDNKPIGEQWITETNGEIIPQSFMVPYNEAPAYKSIYKAWKDGEKFMVIHLEGKKLKEHLGYLAKGTNVPTRDVVLPQQAKEIFNHVMYFSQGCLFIITKEALSEYHDVFKRFGVVFQQSYTRFLDLQKAEMQAREAQIETALEKVRGKAMAMHDSNDLSSAVSLVFTELKKLGIKPIRCGVGLFAKDKPQSLLYTATISNDSDTLDLVGWVNMVGHPVLEKIYDSWQNQEDYFPVLNGKELKTYYKKLSHGLHIPSIPDGRNDEKQYGNFLAFPEGMLNAWAERPYAEPELKILDRFKKIISLTFRRYLDLQKAEEQAREAQIETALERVRSRTMGMQHSDELRGVIQVIFEQFVHLGLDINGAGFGMDYKESDDWNIWAADVANSFPSLLHVPYFDHPYWNRFNEAKRKGLDVFADTLTFEEKNSLFQQLSKYIPNATADTLEFVFSTPGYTISNVFLKNVGLFIDRFTTVPFSDADNATVKRFGKVFEQTYTRFNDLKQAEEQARESQIQLALERVRARTMAMQKSEELAETATVLFQQLLNLGISSERTFIGMPNDDTRKIELWGTEQGGYQMSMRFEYEADATYAFREIYKAWQEKRSELTVMLKGKNLDEHVNYVRNVLHMPLLVGLVQKQRILYNAFFSKGLLMIVTPDTQSKETLEILERFAGVFDGTYTRFLDLQKAEAQARESKIETGLERVRAKAMSMQTSEELNELIGTVFGELTKLDFVLTRCLIMIFDPETHSSRWWMANSEAPAEPMNYGVQYHKHPAYAAYLKAWKERILKLRYDLKGKVKKKWDDFLFVDTELAQLPKPVIEGMKAPQRVILSASFNNFGCLTLVSLEPLSDEHFDLLLRFAKVFDMSYTRFNDLKQAEAQAREAKIQLALERVRARTMAMQKSEELAEVIQVVHDQLYQLDFNIDVANFVLNYNERDDFDLWLAVHGQRYATKIHIPYFDHPIFNRFNEAKEKGLVFFADSFTFEEKNIFFRHFFENAPEVPEERKAVVFGAAGYARSTVFMKNIALSIQNYAAVPYSDAENATLKRFAAVFEQTYIRVKDLEQAEEQAREAKIEAALERVRSRTMAMQKSDELREVIQLIYQQLIHLNFHIDSANFTVDYKESDDVNIWLTSPNFPFATKIHIPYIDTPILSRFNDAKRKGLDFYTGVCTVEEKNQFLHHFYKSADRVPDSVKEFFYNSPGYAQSVVLLEDISLNIQNFSGVSYSETENAALMRFGKVFQQTYTRFLDLKQAEEAAREAKIELALERVRARTMAMYHSEELALTAAVLFEQLSELGDEPARISIGIPDERNDMVNFWATDQQGDQINISFTARISEQTTVSKMYAGWKEKIKSLAINLEGEELSEWVRFCREEMGIIIRDDLLKKQRVHTVGYFSYGWINYTTHDSLSAAIIKVLERFAAVFEQTYRRFLDLQKAERQAKEAKTEAALEKVRAETMAMHNSNDVGNATALVFSELYKLGISTIRCGVVIIEESTKLMEVWSATSPEEGKIDQGSGKLDMTSHPLWQNLFDTWKHKKPVFTYELAGQDLLDYYKAISSAPGYKAPELDPRYAISDDISKATQYCSCFLFAEGGLFTFTGEPFPPEESKVLEKFAAVFSLTYRRYLDLKQAEAQAREARVEAALERVRSKTMAMHTSEDVGDTVATMFDELVKLGVEKTVRSGIAIIESAAHMELWTASSNPNEEIALTRGHVNVTIHPLLQGFYNAWKNKEQHFSYELAGDDLKEYYLAMNNSPDYPVHFDTKSLPSKLFHNTFIFPEGAIFIFSLEQLTTEATQIFKRFAGVFGQTYRRYLDLQKAEAQAREARIETSLERVRSKAMAMRSSEDLAEAIGVFYHELALLSVTPRRCGLGLIDKETRLVELSTMNTIDQENSIEIIGKLKLAGHPVLEGIYDNWLRQEEYHPVLRGNDVKAYHEVIQSQISYPEYPDDAIQYGYYFFFRDGGIFAWTETELPEAEVQIYRRFNSVISLTYRRYKDIREAEAQAREAQIEASLERVRSKAMAMRNSNDLLTAASTVFTELQTLGINQIRSGVGLIAKDFHKAKVYSATSSQNAVDLSLMGEVTLYGHPVFEQQYQSWLKGENYFVALEGATLASYYKILSGGLNADLGVNVKKNQKQYGHWFMFSEGFLYAWSDMEYTDAEIKILERFKNVMELTIRRYIELQKSETQAREAVRQASLDRVRAEIASMRTTGDLERITPLIWNELTILGVPFIRCGVFIMDEPLQQIHTYLSTPDGKAIAAFQLPFNDNSGNGVSRAALRGWRQKQGVTLHWTEEEFKNFSHTLVARGEITSEESYLTQRTVTGLDLHFFPFLQGMLYAGNTEPLSDDDKDLVQSLADAFSTAYARYEDFNSLELAKQEVEKTLTDLKTTQTKLIQSEKMASLGELTAGIAHEIQNPLNFVNNFSEVNQEMIDELEEELNAGNIEEALAIAVDIKQNEQKINHHGKRADAIVKGMLQHSHSGGGEKQPTNINSVADEYMRLSYHGLRAKDKAFNAEMVTHFDPDLPRINVIGQDIGRVLLNLFNNAFYAVNQKKKVVGDGYNPEISVTTLTENGQVIIKVKDNGVGMSDQVKEKIMQPFFTTKPTGEGTGLGLSLTYDMVVKGHGGKIEVNSVEGEGSEFIIALPIN